MQEKKRLRVMKAVVFKKIGKIAVEEAPKPRLQKPSDAIVKITATTICRTDIKILHGWGYGKYNHKPGLVLGHEAVGVVDEVGKEVKKFKPGDRVIISNNVQCGTCFYCLQGRYALCENGGWI
jgi:alcohol dehydrogenase